MGVPRHAKKFCVFKKGITAAGIGNQRKELIAAQIVDPGKWCLRGGDDIFAVGVVKVSEFHGLSAPSENKI